MSTARDHPPEVAAEESSFARGLRILLTVGDRAGVRADELSTLLDTPISTVYRYLHTLAEFGFVDRRGSEYHLGPRLLIGGGANVTTALLVAAAAPVLATLAESTGETALLVRRIGLSAVVLDLHESAHPLRVSVQTGLAAPLHTGALPRALLAFAPPEILDEVLASGAMEAATSEDELRRELAAIGETGVAVTEDPDEGTVTVAVPILRGDGIAAAIGVSGPAARCGARWRMRAERRLRDAATLVAASLG